jgi:hypothetical protein
MRVRWSGRACSALGMLLSLVAVRSSSAQPPVAAPAVSCGGLVVIVGGVGGLDPFGLWARMTLPHAGVPHEIREFCWSCGKGRVLRDLQDARALRERAAELALLVSDYKSSHPDAPVYVVLEAAGLLAPATLERIVLLSAAVSPSYDLRPALRATRCNIVSFHSKLDWAWLQLGTSLFGTMDRVYGPSAGQCGFMVPADLDDEGRALYLKLVQSGWKAEMILECRGGGHFSTVTPCFLAHHLAPLLR